MKNFKDRTHQSGRWSAGHAASPIIMAYAVVAILTLLGCYSCGRSQRHASTLYGDWRLQQYCYGSDCSDLTRYGLEQTWSFGQREASIDSACGDAWRFFVGSQSLSSDVVVDMVWSLYADSDSLTIINTSTHEVSHFLVERSSPDTLVLSSMENNVLEQMFFVRN